MAVARLIKGCLDRSSTVTLVRMVKALLLIFNPVNTWEGIVAAQRGIRFILLRFLLPLLLLSSVAELAGLIRWGKPQGEFGRLQTLPWEVVLNYGVVQLALSFAVLLVGAQMVKSLGETFHGRHTYAEAFTVVAYGLSPLFLVRVLNGLPQVPSWLALVVGIILSVFAVYSGLPRVMRPDPAHALGLYFVSALLLVLTSGLAWLVANLVLHHRIRLVFFPGNQWLCAVTGPGI
jgi:hypothetical protein